MFIFINDIGVIFHFHFPFETVVDIDVCFIVVNDKLCWLFVTFETIYRSGGLIDSSSACGVFTECHCGRLGDHALLGAKYWAPSDDRVG